MAIYYSVVEDDPLDSGGTSQVIEGCDNSTIQGEDGRYRRQTFLGQKAWCDACKSVGVIVAAPGPPDSLRMRDLELNAWQALGGDHVICQCARHPSVISIHARSCTHFDSSGGAAAGAAVAAASLTQVARRNFDDRYILRDADGVPICGTRYTLQRGQGSPENGTTDEQGHTHLHATAADEEDIHIYMGNTA